MSAGQATEAPLVDPVRLAPQPALRALGRWDLVVIVVLGGLVLFIALVGPLLAPHSASAPIGMPYEGASAQVPLGTDYLGRDVLSRVLQGGRTLVILPLVATALAVTFGATVGIVAGFLGGRVDTVAMRLADFVLALPPVVVFLVIVGGWGASYVAVVVAVVLAGVPFVSRISRSTTLQVVRTGYVEQAVAAGESTRAIVTRELLPNVAGPMLADAGLRYVGAIYLVAAASFLGFGPAASSDWALMINENLGGISLAPLTVVVPALLIACLTISVNLLADRLARRMAR